MHRIDGDANVANHFSDGDPGTGTPGTQVTAKFMNAVQEEICAVVEAVGITLDDTDDNQLLKAIRKAPSWINLPYTANWSDASLGTPAQYWKDITGRVTIRGTVEWVSAGSGTQQNVATLPAGYRPSGAQVQYFGMFNLNQNVMFIASVDSSGVIKIVAGGTFTTSNFFVFVSASFPAEA